jgi:hypothetical protein
MLKLELFDETFDPNRTESYELSIQLSLNGFSFCINDTTRNCIIVLCSSPFETTVEPTDDWSKLLTSIISKYEWLAKSFKRVVFCYDSPNFSIVPTVFFDENSALKLLSISNEVDELDEVRYNTKAFAQAVSIFSLPSLLATSWIKLHKNTRFVATCDSALQHHFLALRDEVSSNITLSFTSKFCTIIISSRKKLIHSGTIDSLAIEDIVYHMLNICKQHGLNPNDIRVNTIGYHNQTDSLQLLIDRYFKGVTAVMNADQFHFSYLLSKHKSRFANLFNLLLCE